MRPFREIISLDAARAIISRTGAAIEGTETIPIDRASNRVVSKDIRASADVPPFARAAMDGYAVRAADTQGAGRASAKSLRLTGTLYTGQVSATPVREGECIEIATGAPLPEGADAVVMVEETDVETDAGRVRIYAEVKPQQNVGKRGADIQAGRIVLSAGDVINSSRIGALAAVGLSSVEVYQQPRVAILSTGNEIVEPGHPLGPGQIHDINRFTLSAVVAENGGVPVALPPAPDTIEALTAALDACLVNDIVVFSGGSSVGERDLMIDVLSAKGEVLFHGISVKPGKPTGLAVVAGKPVFAMPGYPASCLTNAHILLVPLLRRMARLDPKPARTVRVPLAQSVASAVNRHQFYTVKIEDGTAVPAFKASGDITSMSRADGYIEIPADIEFVERGSVVDVTLF
jgi:molybdenum cofactor synthesis domain-containing protein